MALPTNKSTLATALSHWNPADLETYLTLYDDNAVLHFLPPGMPQGIAGARQFYGAFFAGFPDATILIDTLVEEGDRVACLYTMEATHRGEFNGIPATGKPVRVSGISILRFAGGKCVERWSEMNLMSLLQQIGVIPAS
ncbi:MAG: ester cyclase [Caldilineales bacterium]